MATFTNDIMVDCTPLTQSCIKALVDRVEDKRKLAANEIEKMTLDFSLSNNLAMINRLIIILGRKFCLSANPNIRKGGLLGLAAVMVGYKNGSVAKPPFEIIEEIIRPILTCFLDSDPRVRYYACESLYNVTKVTKEDVIPLFDHIFDNMCKIVADPDISVRAGAELLDRLLKDIMVSQKSLDIQPIIPRLEECIYTKNPFTRMFIISWIRLLDSKLDMINHLPILLDGIYNCLYDSTEEIRASTLGLLSEFLNKIVTRPTDQVDIPSLVGILLKHARNDTEDVVQYTAIAWLRQFISLMDEVNLIRFSSGILSAILPCLALHYDTEEITSLRSTMSGPQIMQRPIAHSPSRANICEISSLVNSLLLEQISINLSDRRNLHDSESNPNDLEAILKVLITELQKQEHPVIKLAVLDWLRKLKKVEPDLVIADTLQKKLFQILLETLSVSSDAVVKNALRVIADLFCFDITECEQQVPNTNTIQEDNQTNVKDDDVMDQEKRKTATRIQTPTNQQPGSSKKVAIASEDSLTIQHKSTNINRFIQALCGMFRDNETVFDDRGTFIVVNLCSIIKPEVVYKTFAEIIKEDKMDTKFTFNLVQKLNQILLTTQSLFGLRSRLSNDDDPKMTALFLSLYYAWCYSPVAALNLCLLTNNYRLANDIVTALSQADINLDILTQIDWTVQLIESPVFASLRMRLLDASNNQYLCQALFGLLMILPQSEAYRKLSHRLDQVYKFMSMQPHFKTVTLTPAAQSIHKQTGKETMKKVSSTNLEALTKYFLTIQSQIRDATRRT